MAKFAITLALLLGSVALTADAQTQGAANILTPQAQNATIIHKRLAAVPAACARRECTGSVVRPAAGALP